MDFLGSLDIIPTAPAAPAAGALRLARRNLAGRQVLGSVAPDGRTTIYQQKVGNFYTGWFQAHGNAASGFTLFGLASFGLVGTQTVRNWANTSRYSRMAWWSTQTAATAGLLAACYGSTLIYSIGNGSGEGGFAFSARFGTPQAVTGSRMFVGFTNTNAAPTNVEPSTLTNCFGVGHGASDTSLMLYYGGSAAQTPINLNTLSGTSNFPANTAAVDPYELNLTCLPGDQNVRWEVINLRTGTSVSGTITNTTPGTTLPLNSAGLTYRFWRTNNATAAACGLDISTFAIEKEAF